MVPKLGYPTLLCVLCPQDMPRPFTKLKALDIDALAEEVASKLKK